MDTHIVQLLFVDLALVLVVARGFGYLAARVHQPAVIGEIVAGIALGSVILATPAGQTLFPDEVRSLLSGLASVGLAWFMFSVGLEIVPGQFRTRAAAVASVAAWSTLGAFGLGVIAATVLLRRHPAEHPAAFIIFFGLAMSVTAVPVLARILTDRGLLTGTVGTLALTVATVTDVFAWIVLTLILSWSAGSPLRSVALLVSYLAVMLLAARPLVRRLLHHRKADDPRTHALFFGLALLSAAATEAIGVHFIIGAFLAGVVVGSQARDEQRHTLQERAEKATSMLLPVYFVMAGWGLGFAGLRPADLVEGVLVLGIAVIAKGAGSYVAGRRFGLARHDAALLATLLNTRGLTELIILGVGYHAGIIDRPLYSILVAIAIITTVLTGPLISLLARFAPPAEPAARDGDHRTEVPDAAHQPR